MGRSVPRNIDRKGEHLSQCDVCGVMWLRSALTRGRDGLLRCENDRAGRDAITLSEITAHRAAMLANKAGMVTPPDGARPDTDSQGEPNSNSSYTGPTRRYTASDVYNGNVPTGF